MRNTLDLALNLAGSIRVAGAVRGELLPPFLHEAVDSFAVGDEELLPMTRPDTDTEM